MLIFQKWCPGSILPQFKDQSLGLYAQVCNVKLNTHFFPFTTPISCRNLLMCLVETTVYLCISQGFVQMNQLWALNGQEALIKRELGTELVRKKR